MSPFTADDKWMEAKKVIGDLDWVRIISYYRHIGGNKVFVYSIGDNGARLIVDILSDGDTVVLLDSRGKLIEDTYDNITNSRKIFEHSEEYRMVDVVIEGEKTQVAVNK